MAVNNSVSKRFNLFLALGVGMAILSLGDLAYAAETFIKYLPREEDIVDFEKKYDPALVLNEVPCGAGGLAETTAVCDYCLELKDDCPGCCLDLAGKRAIKCRPGASPSYDCSGRILPFSRDICPQIKSCSAGYATCGLSYCQERGCPGYYGTQPYGGVCIADGSDWLCKQANLTLPYHSGCPSEASGCISPCQVTAYYNPAGQDTYDDDLDDDGTPDDPPPPVPEYRYRYTPTTEFSDCTSACIAYARSADECDNTVLCCEENNVCTGKSLPGFGDNCDEVKCETRVSDPTYANPTCDTYTASACGTLHKQLTDCLELEDPTGPCADCLREIDSQFSSESQFVAKSRQALTMIWNLFIEPPKVTESVFLYSRLKVFELDSQGNPLPTPVYTSVLHQRDLGAAFSIFCATHLPRTLLEPGKVYLVKLFYFLPDLSSKTLSIKLNKIRLIVLTVRE